MSTSDATLSLVLKARNLASREVDKLHGSLARIRGAAGQGAGGLLSLGKAAGTMALGGLAIAATALLGFGRAAADEQKGIVRMNAALKANDKSFRGNTDAIEAAISKREELGFSDDDLRDSITKLVTRTKDSSQALALQATAMDLARLKGISVADASDVLTKAMGGNKKILADLGIQLPKTATAAERLAAIQKVAGGQAEAYGKSTAGAMDAFQVAAGDLAEDIGQSVMPILKDVFTWLRTDAIPIVRHVAAKIGDFAKAVWDNGKSPLAIALKALGGFFTGPFVQFLGVAVEKIGIVVSGIGDIIARIRSLLGLSYNKNIEGPLPKGESGTGGGGSGGKRRAAGGPVIPGYTYDVGENGPERLIMWRGGGGMVVPGSRGGRSAANGGFVPAVVSVNVDGHELARIVDERLYYSLAAASPSSSRK